MSELTFSDVIKERRIELGLSLVELSALADTSCSYLKKLEDNRISDPSSDTLVELLLALKLEPNSLPGLTEQEMDTINKQYILAVKKNNNSNNADLDNDYLKIANILKSKRSELNLSLKDLERISGISASYINRLENNYRNKPSLETIKKLSLALNLDISKLPGILPETIANPNKNNIIELIKRETIAYNGITLSIPLKNKICTLIDYILKCDWNNDSKIEDIKTLIDSVDSIKGEKL